MADDFIFDSGRFDENGNPLPPDIIYPPSLVPPCSQYIYHVSLNEEDTAGEDGIFGIHQLQYAIYATGIGSDDRFGLPTLIVTIMHISLAPDDEFGLHTFTPGPVTIYPPSLIEPECT